MLREQTFGLRWMSTVVWPENRERGTHGRVLVRRIRTLVGAPLSRHHRVTLAAAAYNLVRLPKLLEAGP